MESPIHIRRARMCIRRRREYTTTTTTTAAAEGCRYRTVAIYCQGEEACFTASIHSDPEWSVILWQDVPCQKIYYKTSRIYVNPSPRG